MNPTEAPEIVDMIAAPFYTEIFDALPAPIVVLTGNYPYIIIAEANPAYIALTGRAKEAVVGEPYFQFTSHSSMQLEEKGYSDVRESIIKVLTDKAPVKTAVQKFSRAIPGTGDYETLYFEAINTPVFDENNEVRSIIRTLQNVTDMVLTQEKKQEKEALLIKNEKLLREAQQIAGIGSWEIDRSNKVQWSEIHYEIFEREPGQEITIEQANKFLKEDKDRKLFWDVFSKAMATGEYFDIELEVVTVKGNHRWIRFTGQGEIRDGAFIRMYGTCQNITDKKKIEHELLHSRNQLEALIQTVDGIVWEADAQTLELLFISPQVENITGYTVTECMSKPGFWRDCIYSVDKEAVIAYGSTKVQAGQSFTYDYRIIKKDGTIAWMKASTSVIKEDGKPKWLRGLIIDITASKRLEQLEHLEKSVLQLNARPGEPITNVLKTYLQGLEYIFPKMHCAIMR